MTLKSNAIKKKTAFGTPEQRGNLTIYPAATAEMLRTARVSKLLVAAYVRVSTDSVQQEGSLALQKEYYESYIKNNPEDEFVEIYEDDGISATGVEKRKGFLKMMEDCKAGKIDLTLRFRIVAKYNEPSNVAIFEMKNAIASEIPRNIHGGRPKKHKPKLTFTQFSGQCQN